MPDMSFIQHGRELASVKGKRCGLVPFKKKTPHYRDLNQDQLNYYLYLRDNLRRGKVIPAPDNETGLWPFNMQYLRLYFFELLNGIGTKSVGAAYKQMRLLIDSTNELAGFPGQREVTWETSLVEGKNLLPLKLVALTPAGGEVLARLEHENRGRTFRLRVNIS